MRWIYFNDDPREAVERAAVVGKIDAWWRAFEAKVSDLEAHFSQKARWDLPQWMFDHLQSIHPDIMWEYGPAVSGEGHRLVLTPESAHELRPLVDQILKRAPVIPGWEFYDARIAEDLEMAKSTVQARAGYDIDDFQVRVSVSDKGLVDLCYVSPRIRNHKDQTALNAAFIATESLLGEHCLDRWVGLIEVNNPRKIKGLTIKLERLKDTVEAAIEGLRDQLPPAPHCDRMEDASWTIWELKPRPAPDFPGQLDLFVGKSANAPMWTAAHSNGPFYSERFTRSGETFCYLKIDGAEGLENSTFLDKSEIEDAVDEALMPQQLGCHVGGGMGLRYAYLDLALTDVPRAINTIRERMQAGRIPLRSWILFFDSHLANEWVGIYDNSPIPPGFDN